LPMELGKFQSLMELDLFHFFKLGNLLDSVVDLSQHKRFRLWGCLKLETLLVEFGRLKSLVELNLFGCSELGCLPNSIVDVSHLKKIRFCKC
jgi:hypothetical protein